MLFSDLVPTLEVEKLYFVVGNEDYADYPYQLSTWGQALTSLYGNHEVVSVNVKDNALCVRVKEKGVER